ncbi:MAG: hypothetical protein SGJ18_06330 [Pseudomonadota bacterium]|nr:hypothetical protein [Pseudomonadota bacterium]
MAQSTLAIQSGLHKIYQRILIQIPNAHLSGVAVQNLKAQINSRGNILNRRNQHAKQEVLNTYNPFN